MAHRKIKYLTDKKVIYRCDPINDDPSHEFEWGEYYEDGTYECYELFRTKAKINTYKSLKWHFLVLRYLNQHRDDLKNIFKYISIKTNGFTTFNIPDNILNKLINNVFEAEIRPPKNKLRKVIFKDYSMLSTKEKLSIVGKLVGRIRKITEKDIYAAMLDINELDEKITITKIAIRLNCSTRTVYRVMGNTLKKEKENLNRLFKNEVT